MDNSHIMILRCFPKRVVLQFPTDIINNLFQFKFDGNGELIVLGNFFLFIQFCLSNGIFKIFLE